MKQNNKGAIVVPDEDLAVGVFPPVNLLWRLMRIIESLFFPIILLIKTAHVLVILMLLVSLYQIMLLGMWISRKS